MRICVVGLRGVPGVMGGVEAHCEELFPRVKRRMADADITIVARKPYVRETMRSFRGVKIASLPSMRSKHLEAVVHTFFAVLHAKFALRAEVVHIHAVGPGLLAPLARLLGMRAVVTHHSKNYDHAKWGTLARSILRFGEWCAVHAADRVITVSKSLAADLRKSYPRLASKVVCIPNGASALAEAQSPGVLTKLHLIPKSYILAVGRLTPEKGFDDLVAACRGLDRTLVIAGGADLESGYAQSLQDKAPRNIIFAGAVARADLASLYANSALFVLPSYHEGLPIAALEAIASGAPILLSDIGPNLELGLSARNYFPVGDVVALKARLQGDLAALAVDRGAILARYDWDEAAAATCDVYASIARSIH